MKVWAQLVIPIHVQIDIPNDTPALEIRRRIIDQARLQIENNGATYRVLAASIAGIVDADALRELGVHPEVEYVYLEPQEPDTQELREFGTGCYRAERSDEW